MLSYLTWLSALQYSRVPYKRPVTRWTHSGLFICAYISICWRILVVMWQS